MKSRKAIVALLHISLVCASFPSSADTGSRDVAPAGHGVRVFLGYLDDYKPDSTQSRFVEAKLSSYGVKPADHSVLIDYFRDLDAEIDADIENGTARLLCNARVARLQGIELLPVINAYLDFGDATYARYSALAAADLAGLGFPELISHLYQDAKEAGPFNVRFDITSYERPEYIEEVRAEICDQLDPPTSSAN